MWSRQLLFTWEGRIEGWWNEKVFTTLRTLQLILKLLWDTATIIWNSYFALLCWFFFFFARGHFCISLKRWTLSLGLLSLWSAQRNFGSSSAYFKVQRYMKIMSDFCGLWKWYNCINSMLHFELRELARSKLAYEEPVLVSIPAALLFLVQSANK